MPDSTHMTYNISQVSRRGIQILVLHVHVTNSTSLQPTNPAYSMNQVHFFFSFHSHTQTYTN